MEASADIAHKFVGRARVTAHSPMDVPYLWEARRFFPTKGYKEIEVLDQEQDPPDIVTKRPNKNSGLMQDIVTADQERVGQESYRLICANPRFGVQEMTSINGQIMQAEIASGKAQVMKLTGELVDLKGANARLKAENEQLIERNHELEAMLSSATDPKANEVAAEIGDAQPRKKAKDRERTVAA